LPKPKLNRSRRGCTFELIINHQRNYLMWRQHRWQRS